MSLAFLRWWSALVAESQEEQRRYADAECPQCREYLNLLDAPDFWDGRTLDIPEHGTENSDNLDVECPRCGHEFRVCCEW
jgi:DNA-directed RNA polymerase subunit RPC12/RpoP